MKLKEACADCKFLVKYYGRVNTIGGREPSKYWCIQRNGFVKTGLEKCSFRISKKEKKDE